MMKPLASLARRPAGEMNLVGGRLFLDFVNTVGARHNSRSKEKTVHDDKLNDYCDLLAWGQHVKLLSEAEVRTLAREASRRPQEASAVFKRAIQLREALYRICRAIRTKGQPEQPCLDVINEELRVARGRERLVSDKALFSLKCDAPISALDRVLWFVTQSAAEWLTTGELSRLRECRGDPCGWIFEDLSRNRSRQWCDMNDCGNRAKIRRFRLRQQRTQRLHHRLKIRGAELKP